MLSGKYRGDTSLQPQTRFTLGSAANTYQTRYCKTVLRGVDGLSALLRDRKLSMVASP